MILLLFFAACEEPQSLSEERSADPFSGEIKDSIRISIPPDSLAITDSIPPIPDVACSPEQKLPLVFHVDSLDVELGFCRIYNSWRYLTISFEPKAGLHIRNTAVWIGPGVSECQTHPIPECQPPSTPMGKVNPKAFTHFKHYHEALNRVKVQIPIDQVSKYGYISIWAFCVSYDQEGNTIFDQETFAKGTLLPSGARVSTFTCERCQGMDCEPWKLGEPPCM